MRRLSDAGAHVECIHAYGVRVPADAVDDIALQQLREGEIDAVCVTSAAEVRCRKI